jgi:hypothetical protein
MRPNFGDPAAALAAFQALEERVRALERQLAELVSPDGSVTLKSGQSVTLAAGDNRLTVDTTGISLRGSGRLQALMGGPAELGGVMLTLSGAQIRCEAPIVKADGIVQGDTLIVNTVVAASYTPGAGNVW